MIEPLRGATARLAAMQDGYNRWPEVVEYRKGMRCPMVYRGDGIGECMKCGDVDFAVKVVDDD